MVYKISVTHQSNTFSWSLFTRWYIPCSS